MKIGLIGVGHIGQSLAVKLAAAGHDVKVANSRGPETIEPDALSSGARAVAADDTVVDVDVLILSVPPSALAALAPLVAKLPDDAILIDTSNYYPLRDGKFDALEDGQIESVWVSEQLGRPVIKAWNAIHSESLARRGLPAGSPERIAIPVAGDDGRHRHVAMALVEDTGFDAYDAGVLADSWRQQPGAPCYCTDLTRDELPAALAAANRERLPARRELAVAAIMERMGDPTTNPDADYGVRLHRVLFL